MPTHLDLFKTQSPSLVIDGSGNKIFAGVLSSEGNWISASSSDGAALENLFSTVEAALKSAGSELSEIGSYVYNAGPGSVLGLRLTAMALETWARLHPGTVDFYAYNTLQYVMQIICKDHPEIENALLVSDWKSNAWNAVRLTNGKIGPTVVVDNKQIEISSVPLFHLPQRKGWQSPPQHAKTILLDPHRLPEIYRQPDLLKPTHGIELYSNAINTFQKWTPERHRASGT